MGFLALLALWILVSAAFTPLIGYFLSESQDELEGTQSKPSEPSLSSRPRREIWADHTNLPEAPSLMAHAPGLERSSRPKFPIEPPAAPFPPKQRR